MPELKRLETEIFWQEEWEKRAGNLVLKGAEPSQRSDQKAVVVLLPMRT
jgi:hypothetical protein